MTELPTGKFLRTVRSFVRRSGRLTAAQQRAMDEQWAHYGIENAPTPLNLDTLFKRRAPVTVEIGFGMGDTLVQLAAEHPARNYLGIEVHRPGVGTILRLAEEQGVDNLKIISDDAVVALGERVADASLDAVLLFFPDPWHKLRHRKRRIVQPDFVALVRRKLKPGGVFHMATDWENYARHMLTVMQQAEGFRNCAPNGAYLPRPDTRPLTKFEQRGQRLGHGVWDLVFERIGD